MFVYETSQLQTSDIQIHTIGIAQIVCVYIEQFRNKNALMNVSEVCYRGELIKWSVQFVYSPLELMNSFVIC